MAWIVRTFVKYKPVAAEHITVVRDGEMLPLLGGLSVLATPGHTSDHVAYYSAATGIVFAGDALHTRKGKLQCSPKSISADYGQAQQSAILLANLSPAIFGCGHGQPYLHSFEDLMELLSAARSA
jgi:glyoxylase-like metal-dependent hydrolase (beta-lactamase superfamily II)